jgi:hypothetical protein
MVFLLAVIAMAFAALWPTVSAQTAFRTNVFGSVMMILSNASILAIVSFFPMAFVSSSCSRIVCGPARAGEEPKESRRRTGTAAAVYILMYGVMFWVFGAMADFRTQRSTSEWESVGRFLLPIAWPFSIPFLLAQNNAGVESPRRSNSPALSNGAIFLFGALSLMTLGLILKSLRCG